MGSASWLVTSREGCRVVAGLSLPASDQCFVFVDGWRKGDGGSLLRCPSGGGGRFLRLEFFSFKDEA